MSRQVNNIEKMRDILSQIDGHERLFGYYGHSFRTPVKDRLILNEYQNFQSHRVEKQLKWLSLDDLLNSRSARHCMDALTFTSTEDDDFDAFNFLEDVAHNMVLRQEV